MNREEIIQGIRQSVAKLEKLAMQSGKPDTDEIQTTTACIYAGLSDLAWLDGINARKTEEMRRLIEEMRR